MTLVSPAISVTVVTHRRRAAVSTAGTEDKLGQQEGDKPGQEAQDGGNTDLVHECASFAASYMCIEAKS